MARIRTIKPEFFISEQVAECSPNARLLFIGLWCFCDDGGVHKASTRQLKMEVFPGDNFSLAKIQSWVDELINQRLLAEFEANGERYWYVTGWAKHQRIEKPAYRYPRPGTDIQVADQSPTTRQPFVEESGDSLHRKGEERKGKERREKDDGAVVEWSPTAPAVLPTAKNSQAPLSSGDAERDEIDPGQSRDNPGKSGQIDTEWRSNGDARGSPVFITLPLVDGTEAEIMEAEVAEWEETYPAVDVRQELREIRQWNLSNPDRRKTRKGWRKHVTEWFAREQDKGPHAGRGPPGYHKGSVREHNERVLNEWLADEEAESRIIECEKL